MKKFLRILAVIVIVLIVAIAGFYFYIAAYLPNIKAPENLVVEINPERLERGNYLANSVMGCMECHAKRDFNLYAGPVIESTKGAGGERWDHSLGFPGTIYSPNITPTHLSDWSDGELYRAIAAGVGKDGEALFPIMPYHRYAKLPEEDIYAIIAYLRSLEAKPGEYPKKELDFPLSLIVNTIPAEPTHDLGPSADPVKHGEYLITAAACYDCHTMMDERGQFNEEMAYAGGMEFGLPTGGKVFASNITPDKETGIGLWSEEEFVYKFKQYDDSTYQPVRVNPGEFNTMMPWEYYCKMKEEDLKAIYAYLMLIKPIQHKVAKFVEN